MRLALVSTPFVAVPPRAYGGTELVVSELARGLRRAGHQVTVFATGDSDDPDVRWVYEQAVWPPDPSAEQVHCRAAAREIARGEFDLVHAHSPAFLAHASEVEVPLVYTVHHVHDPELELVYLAHPDVRLVAISRRQAELLSPGLAAHVVHHGLDPEVFPAGRGESGSALFLGRLSWCKGPDVAVEAARRAGVELMVAGTLHEEPTDPPGWPEEVDRLLAQPGVRRLGSVGGERKQRLLGSARALLMPIRWEEPFGLVMIEAMLSGTPVIAFPCGAAPEVVEEGVTGFLARDAAEMADALARASELDREACRRRACQRFSSSRMILDYLRVYHAALARSRLPARPAAAATEEHSHVR